MTWSGLLETIAVCSLIKSNTGCQSDLNNPGAPSIDALSSTTACDTYTLPAITGTNLSGNQSYFTQSNGAGTPLSEGDVISSTQTIYIYDILGTCADESNFTITRLTTHPHLPIQALRMFVILSICH